MRRKNSSHAGVSLESAVEFCHTYRVDVPAIFSLVQNSNETIKFFNSVQKGAGETPAPTPSAVPEPQPTPTPVPPMVTPPPASAEPVFSIDRWLAYAQNYARSAGLNLDPAATACWDNPTTDVWIWAEPRADGSYDLYIGYA